MLQKDDTTSTAGWAGVIAAPAGSLPRHRPEVDEDEDDSQLWNQLQAETTREVHVGTTTAAQSDGEISDGFGVSGAGESVNQMDHPSQEQVAQGASLSSGGVATENAAGQLAGHSSQEMMEHRQVGNAMASSTMSHLTPPWTPPNIQQPLSFPLPPPPPPPFSFMTMPSYGGPSATFPQPFVPPGLAQQLFLQQQLQQQQQLQLQHQQQQLALQQQQQLQLKQQQVPAGYMQAFMQVQQPGGGVAYQAVLVPQTGQGMQQQVQQQPVQYMAMAASPQPQQMAPQQQQFAPSMYAPQQMQPQQQAAQGYYVVQAPHAGGMSGMPMQSAMGGVGGGAYYMPQTQQQQQQQMMMYGYPAQMGARSN